jgi:hypothetical protein
MVFFNDNPGLELRDSNLSHDAGGCIACPNSLKALAMTFAQFVAPVNRNPLRRCSGAVVAIVVEIPGAVSFTVVLGFPNPSPRCPPPLDLNNYIRQI